MIASTARPHRIVVVDDSAMVRKLVTQKLNADGRLEVVALANTAEEARQKMATLGCDVLLVDEHLPGMSGTQLLRRIMSTCPVPSVLFSSDLNNTVAARARREGVTRLFAKPSALSDRQDFWRGLANALVDAVVEGTPGLNQVRAPAEIIGIAVSTGGPAAVQQVVEELQPGLPPVVIVQHMRPTYLAQFADQLNRASSLVVRLASDGERLLPNMVYVAPPGQQPLVERTEAGLVFRYGGREPISGHTPSGDSLLYSIAYGIGGRAVGAVMTGMGVDGAAGLLAMRRGGRPYGGSRPVPPRRCFGMPKAAAEAGAARLVVPLESLSQTLSRQAVSS